MYKLLVVEDDPALSKGLEVFLTEEGYAVTCNSDGRRAHELVQREIFDVLILDLGLPGKSGEDICRDLRSSGNSIPILMLTSKNTVEEKVRGFTIGADEYLTKPFDLTELNARIGALLRRPRQLTIRMRDYKFADVVIDFESNRIERDGKRYTGTAKEFDVLRFLVQNENKVVSRDDILNSVWGMEAFPTPRTVDNFILSLRKKLEVDPQSPRHLISIYGSGYQFLPKG